MSTTFEIQADDYSNITLAVVTPEGPESRTLTNYQVNLASIRFHEEARIKFQYAQYQHREGGEVRDATYPLVPVSFTGRVIGLGATPALRLADLAQKSADLMRVITNSNGYLKYKPDGLAAGILDTYYRYIQSNPPRPLSGATEYWGRTRATLEPTTYTEGIPTRQFEITMMTHPFAMSDPTSPVEVLSATTLNNIGDGTNDYVTIANATIKGSVPALTRIIAHPLTAGADAAIGTLWLAKRTSGLGSFVADYFTSAAVAPTGVWSTETDASRCNGEYYRCTPATNSVVYARRYTVANWSSHKGRAAILIVARNNGTGADDFDVYYRWSIANYPLTGENKQLTRVEAWEPLLLGEIDLPETEMSAQENLDLYIDICVVRVSGSGTFDLDCLKLLFTDEAALRADAPSDVGIDSSHSFLLESLDEEIAHAIVHADNKLAYICNPYGDFIALEPDSDNRLDVAWKRYSLAVFEDDFSGYDTYWKKIASFETSEDWAGDFSFISSDVEGTSRIRISHNAPGTKEVELAFETSVDLSSFEGAGRVGWWAQKQGLVGTITVEVRLKTDDSNYYHYSHSNAGLIGTHYTAKFSDFSSVGAPNWNNINKITVRSTANHEDIGLIIDDMRVSMAYPNEDGSVNDTGETWSFESGASWRIYELDETEKALGFSQTVFVEIDWVSLIATNYGADIQLSGKVKIRDSGTGGAAGLVFRCTDGASGSEDCYALLINTDINQVWLRSYVAGTPSNVAAPVSYICSEETYYYLGVIIRGTSIKCYVSDSETTLWNAGSRRFSTTDSDHSNGQCGVIAVNTQARFTDISLESVADVHIPTDQLQLSAYALFRTIYPFYES